MARPPAAAGSLGQSRVISFAATGKGRSVHDDEARGLGQADWLVTRPRDTCPAKRVDLAGAERGAEGPCATRIGKRDVPDRFEDVLAAVRSGRLADAERILATALPSDDRSAATAARLRAWVEVERGNFAAALGILDELLSRSPGDATAWYDRGRVAARSGRLNDAAAGFRTALLHQPDMLRAAAGLSDCLHARERMRQWRDGRDGR